MQLQSPTGHPITAVLREVELWSGVSHFTRVDGKLVVEYGGFTDYEPGPPRRTADGYLLLLDEDGVTWSEDVCIPMREESE